MKERNQKQKNEEASGGGDCALLEQLEADLLLPRHPQHHCHPGNHDHDDY